MTHRPSPHTASQPDTPSVSAPMGSPSPIRDSLSRSLFSSLHTIRQEMSLQALIVATVVVPVIAAVGITGWLSFRNGQRAVEKLATQLQVEIGDQVSTHLDYYLNVPLQLNEINLKAVTLGWMDLKDFEKLGSYFWQQMQVFDVGYINYANEAGEFIGVERLDDGSFLTNETARSSPTTMSIYATDNQGNRTQLKEIVPEQEPIQLEGWYADAVKAQRPVWSEIYQWNDKPEVLSISSSYPVYDTKKNLIGVIGVDLILSQISSFLNQLNISPSARIFIVEQDGSIVANSGESPSYVVTNGEPQRVQAINSSDELIRATAQHLQDVPGDDNLQQNQASSFTFKGEKQFVQVFPWQDELGLDWRIVVVLPESDFMAQINANTRLTIGLCLVTLILTTLLGVLISRWIAHPLVQLGQASQAIASGDFDQTVEVNGVKEVNILSQSFNRMTQRLQASFTALETSNQLLEQRVAQRTMELHHESQLLQQDVNQLLEVVQSVEEGDLTVEAAVPPRATGLVADTLNRLIERLGETMANALSTAEQVTQGAAYLQQLSTIVANNAHQQSQSLSQVQNLVEDINDRSQNAAGQARATDQAIQLAQSAIDQGQEEITALSDGIKVLQQSADQIAKRTQTLNSYVELATQFAKDQKRIASMTRILAVNASMLANRAATQQDPEQFASITRELETVATQVNDLAVQTNQSLLVLQQRTGQIQTVVSGLDHDVQSISHQMNDFTMSVEQSRQSFDTIKSVSEQVAHTGQQVSQSSQTIAQSAQATLQSVRTIATIAVQTSTQANITQEQSHRMEQAAQALLQTIEFFQLPPDVNSLTAEGLLSHPALPSGQPSAAKDRDTDITTDGTAPVLFLPSPSSHA